MIEDSWLVTIIMCVTLAGIASSLLGFVYWVILLPLTTVLGVMFKWLI